LSELSQYTCKMSYCLNNQHSHDGWVAYELSCSKCGWKLYGTQDTEYGLGADDGALRVNLRAWKPSHMLGKHMEAATQPLQVHHLMANPILPSNHPPSANEVGLQEKKVASCSAALPKCILQNYCQLTKVQSATSGCYLNLHLYWDHV
jgi:hypothetical protein